MSKDEQAAPDQPTGLTVLLNRMARGDRHAGERAVSIVYAELHQIAGMRMRHEPPGSTLQTTALVHEAYSRLVGGAPLEVRDRQHFFAIASQQMRRILVDHARRRRATGESALTPDIIAAGKDSVEVLSLHEALEELQQVEPRTARVVELRYFGGYTDKEVAEVLGISFSSVRRDWEFARAWLYDRMRSRHTQQ